MSNELYLATTVEGVEIEIEVYEGQQTVVVPGRGSFTLPSRGRARLFVNDGLDVDPILPIVPASARLRASCEVLLGDRRLRMARTDSTSSRTRHHGPPSTGMALEWTHGIGEGGVDMAEQYTGPSALRIANLLPHRVSFERSWFWTTTEICHGGKSDGLAFRQQPDGNGIDVRCHTGGCSAGVVITELETLIGLPIWTAYEPVSEAADKAPEKRPWWKRKRVAVAGVVALVVAAPLITGDVEVFVLNLVGLGIGALLLRRLRGRGPLPAVPGAGGHHRPGRP